MLKSFESEKGILYLSKNTLNCRYVSLHSLTSVGLAVRLLAVGNTDVTSLPAEHGPSFDKDSWKINQNKWTTVQNIYTLCTISKPWCLPIAGMICAQLRFAECSRSVVSMVGWPSHHCPDSLNWPAVAAPLKPTILKQCVISQVSLTKQIFLNFAKKKKKTS